jgi:hypothetical protein
MNAEFEGSGRMRSLPNRGTIPDVCLEGLRKIMKSSVMIEGTAAEIRTLQFPSASLGRDRCASLLGLCAPSAKLWVTTLLNLVPVGTEGKAAGT